MDASNIATRLWIGSKPPFDRDLPKIDVLVLCAAELQPTHVAFHGRVVRCPLPDAQLTQRELNMAIVASSEIALDLVAHKTVLVTCHQGINRSALVAALALGRVSRRSAAEIIRLIRAKRNERCLDNPYFVQYLERLITEERSEVHRAGPVPSSRVVRRR